MRRSAHQKNTTKTATGSYVQNYLKYDSIISYVIFYRNNNNNNLLILDAFNMIILLPIGHWK